MTTTTIEVPLSSLVEAMREEFSIHEFIEQVGNVEVLESFDDDDLVEELDRRGVRIGIIANDSAEWIYNLINQGRDTDALKLVYSLTADVLGRVQVRNF